MKVAIIQNIAPLYRYALWQKLSRETNPEYSFISSSKNINGIRVIDPDLAKRYILEGGIRWSFIKNIVISGRVIWQSGIISFTIKSNLDLYIYLGDMNIISTWISSIICKIRRKKVVFWGHGLYGNEAYLKKKIRLLFYKIPHAHFIYNVRSRNLMRLEGFNIENLFVVYNSLNYDQHREIRNSITKEKILYYKRKLFPGKHNLPIIVFIGRLTSGKKVDQLLKAIKIIIAKGKTINCLIIGHGNQDSILKESVKILDISESVIFYGPCYDEETNGALLSLADCCVSPGNVGLNAIHSLSFGTPVITHNDLCDQGPEASSIIDNYTGGLFEKDNINSLAEKIIEIVFIKGKEYFKENCIKTIDDNYNPDNQVRIFNEACISIYKQSN